MALILVIDDDRRFRPMLRALLEEAGHEVIEETEGRAGIVAYRARRPDVALVDIIMPGKGGIATIGEIHMEFPDAKLIAMSGGDPRGPLSDLPIAWAYGAMRSLQKPFGKTALLAAIEEALQDASARPAIG
jgi:DNA-binding NtrC family response regulator